MSEQIKDFDKMPLQKKIETLAKLKQKREQEIKDLEEQAKKDADLLNSELLETMKELSLEEQKEFLEEQEKKNKDQEKNSLEDKLEGVQTKKGEEKNFSYKTSQPMNIYELTDYNLYSRVRELVNKAEEDFISPEEKNFLSSVAYNIERIKKQNPYESIKQYDSSNYLSRASHLLGKISKDINKFNY